MKPISMMPLAALAVGALLLGGCVAPQGQATAVGGQSATGFFKTSAVREAPQSKAAERAKFRDDREAILKMAGSYRVTFDFQETVPFAEGYELKERKISEATEVVRVIEDTGRFISLQHTLVVGAGPQKFPVKHWRQDWTYEPEDVLVFIGGNAWETRKLSERSARGKWSQEVYQVDDSPRYGALARWTHANGVSQWQPPREWRPLPRRDATTRDDYHAVDAINRHAITPFGWVHEQDNAKIDLTGDSQILAREIGVNTYREADDFDVSIADDYWEATKAYWAGVRSIWADLEAGSKRFAITAPGETEPVYQPLLGLAEAVKSGETSVAEAIAQARETIARFTTDDISTLEDRIDGGLPPFDQGPET